MSSGCTAITTGPAMAGDGRDSQRSVMRASRPDAFALKNAGLQAFLYADVGTEPNGSTLTMLSVLARLGEDPWAQAASWAAMPKAVAIDNLSRSIAQMGLMPAALTDSREIAARLVEFLPATSRTVIPAASDGATPAMPNGQLAMMLLCGIATWAWLALILAVKPATDVRPAGPSMVVAGSVATVAAPPSSHTSAGASMSTVLPGAGQRTQAR